MRSLALLLIAVTGCSVDRGKCLESHEETVLVPQYMTTCTNGVCTMRLMYFLPIPTTRCDRWEYPEGRPKPQGQHHEQ